MSENCLTHEQMEGLIVNRQLGSVMDHIEKCTRCQHLLEACMEEQSDMHQALYPDKLDDSFTDLIMAAIEADKNQYDGNIGEKEPSLEHMATPVPTRKKRSRKKWIAAVIFLFLVISNVFAQPTVANWMRSMLGMTADIGLTQAEKLGIHRFVNVAVRDKGITLEVKELAVDTSRLVIVLRVLGPYGIDLNNLFRTDTIDVLDSNGKSIVDPNATTSIENRKDKWWWDEYLVIDMGLKETLAGDHITIRGNVDHFDFKRWDWRVNGNWSFEIGMDMRSAREQMKMIPLEGEYVAPDGTRIKPTRIIHHASAFQIEFRTQLPPNAAPPIEGLSENYYHEIGFYLQEQSGRKIASSGYYRDKSSSEPAAFPLRTSCDVEESKKVVTCTYTFGQLTELPEQAELVIDNYHYPIYTNDSISLEVKDLQSNPAVFKTRGDEIRIGGVNGIRDSFVSKAEGIKPSLWLKASGRYSNETSGDQWTARDEHGHEFTVYLLGSYGESEDAYRKYSGEMVIGGLNHIPKKLTITRTATDMRYQNIKWSMKLPNLSRNL
ncbi:hypothetical protein AZ66_17640 [Paenibacillus sp. E194]|uniref:DUF4179 domain-containing protein n=1 Tax=Paenibacillus sp. E194 TaxID=1458845 RepID=UPI0005C8DB43|nr:DUF4179 domain-containing protein [Paenibacillus sp. E194]KJB86633.1 hypothetical protein AZ66_17640 [Paenibacillus sp. E194]